ncbi:TetR family transcriptional regulator [Nocardioides sp. dk4132]|uniref:TetR/AcrR family transcriptional regulator n=1 Tax=unclassified Nocardioides TaxID=2615069 RepID=UPI001296C8EC|nr:MULTISPECIES: TetR family transcriptional regulator [unclassified Nocardioides]MQW77106.1 TetR family transcriptional regulator [Nocardioides sp. dk4132]QGA05995.1 TetR family transcriptional regulator [Nocardioides sp. dk884]
MTSPALSTREARRLATEIRIARCAQILTAERGLDGFTMDDLAEASALSRRTLFNYFPGKLDAVLGPVPVIAEDTRARFVEGGPHGRLVDDLAVLAHELLDGQSDALDREDIARITHLITTTPRLLTAVIDRFEEFVGGFVDLIVEREQGRVDAVRARLLVRLLVTVFESAIGTYVAGDERSIPDLFDRTLAAARDLFT